MRARTLIICCQARPSCKFWSLNALLIVQKVPARLTGRAWVQTAPFATPQHGCQDCLLCLQAVELALGSLASPPRPREPIRRLQSMRQTAAKAGNAVLGVGRFSAKVRAPLPLRQCLRFCHPTTQVSMQHGIWHCNLIGVPSQHGNVRSASLQMGVGLASFSMKRAASFASVPFRVPIRAAQRQYFPIGRQLFLYPDIVTTSAPGELLWQLAFESCNCCCLTGEHLEAGRGEGSAERCRLSFVGQLLCSLLDLCPSRTDAALTSCPNACQC